MFATTRQVAVTAEIDGLASEEGGALKAIFGRVAEIQLADPTWAIRQPFGESGCALVRSRKSRPSRSGTGKPRDEPVKKCQPCERERYQSEHVTETKRSAFCRDQTGSRQEAKT